MQKCFRPRHKVVSLKVVFGVFVDINETKCFNFHSESSEVDLLIIYLFVFITKHAGLIKKNSQGLEY